MVLIHSFRGLEPEYRDMADRFASEDFVVIAPGGLCHPGRKGSAQVTRHSRWRELQYSHGGSCDAFRVSLEGTSTVHQTG